MKNLLKGRSLIRLVVIIVVSVSMAMQMQDAEARNRQKCDAETIIREITSALQEELDEIREEIANHTHDGSGGGGGDGDCSCPGDILPAGGRTVAGPGLRMIDGGAIGKAFYANLTSTTQKICVTLANTTQGGTDRVKMQHVADIVLLIEPGQTKTVCLELEGMTGATPTSNQFLYLETESGDSPSTIVYRVDSYDNL